jgi:hypothetical protein
VVAEVAEVAETLLAQVHPVIEARLLRARLLVKMVKDAPLTVVVVVVVVVDLLVAKADLLSAAIQEPMPDLLA